MLNSISSCNPSLLNIEAEVDVNQIHSQTEKTIREYHPRGTTPPVLRQLVKGNDGKCYPKNPDNNYVSRFSERFRGYLSYGSLDHIFRACPQKASLIFGHIHLSLGSQPQIHLPLKIFLQPLLLPQPLTLVFCLLIFTHILLK